LTTLRRSVEDNLGVPADAKLRALMREATNYVGGIVESALEPAALSKDMLRSLHAPLLDACADDSPAGFVDVITLNHDTLLETSFRSWGVEDLEDGFEPPRVLQRAGYVSASSAGGFACC
jgi:hypothetical protein